MRLVSVSSDVRGSTEALLFRAEADFWPFLLLLLLLGSLSALSFLLLLPSVMEHVLPDWSWTWSPLSSVLPSGCC